MTSINWRVAINLKSALLINFVYGLFFLALSIISINLIDKDLAYWLHVNSFDHFLVLNHFTQNSPQIIGLFSVVILLAIPIDKSYGRKIILVVVGLILLYVALKLKTELKCILGRNWPLFCLGEWAANSSPFKNNYGINFNWHSSWAGTLPSGHATFISLVSLMMVRLYPRFMRYYIAYTCILIICLVWLNYHFFGDCLAGVSLAFLVNSLFIVFQYLIQYHGSRSLRV